MGGPKKLRRRRPLSLLRDLAGTATVETVIMIPVLVGIWGGIWYTHQRYRKAINMAQATRAHAWQYSWANCEGSHGTTSISTGAFSADSMIPGRSELPFGDVIPHFRFDEIEATREASLERPSVLGEGTVTMRHNLVLLCNEEIQGGRSFASVAWSLFFGG